MSIKLLKSKKGFKASVIEGVILGFILVVVLFKVIAALVPSLFQAGDELNASGLPFGEFFATGGLVWLILAAGILILIIRYFMKMSGGNKGGKGTY